MHTRHRGRTALAVTAIAVVLGATHLVGSGTVWAAGSTQSQPTTASHARAQAGGRPPRRGADRPAARDRHHHRSWRRTGGHRDRDGSGAPYQHVFARSTVVGQSAHGVGVNLTASDYTVQAMSHGAWLMLPGATNVTNGPYLDGAALTVPLANGHATRTMYRVTVSASVAKDVNSVRVVITAVGDGHAVNIVDVPLTS